jgi:hypothetical protein
VPERTPPEPEGPGADPAGPRREPGADGAAASPRRARRANRRVTTAPPEGSDPTPQREPERHALTENDDRLRAEKPPHY